MPAKPKAPVRSEEDIRQLVHAYFYERYKTHRAARGKNGIATTISVIHKDLKEEYDLSQQQVSRSLVYLEDEGWLRVDTEEKAFTTQRGTVQRTPTRYYRITSEGVDKIEGESEYTAQKFHGINITATGQSVVTVGDGNVVNAEYAGIGNEIASFKESVVTSTELDDRSKMTIVADIDTVQAQLASPEPRRSILEAAWVLVQNAVTGTSLLANAATIAVTLSTVVG